MEKVKKMTKKDYLGVLRDLALNAGNVDAADFCEREIERLANKKTTQTKTQKENDVIIEVIYDAIEKAGAPVTISEIMADEGVAAITVDGKALTNQKVSALITKLKLAGRVVRTEIKKKAYFEVATDVE